MRSMSRTRNTTWSISRMLGFNQASLHRERLLRRRGGAMAMVIGGLLKDAHQARGVIRALDDAGFSGDDIDMSGGLLAQLVARGAPDEEAHAFAEGVRRGGAIVCVRTDDEEEAAEAAELMCAHGAIDIDGCTSGWKTAGWRGRYEAQPDVPAE